MKNYFIVRLCNKADGTVAAPVASFETEADAWKEFYRLCGQAVDSAHLTDTVMIVTKDGFMLDHKTFAHEVVPAEPAE